MTKGILATAAGVAALAAAAAINPAGVTVVEGAAGATDITYTLSGTEPEVVTMEVFTNGVSAGGAGVRHAYGDVWRLVQPGAATRTIRWRADRDLEPSVYEAGDFRVVLTAWATNAPPDYMVVDLVTTNFTYYPAADYLPAGGPEGDRAFATSLWVFRKIPAAMKWFTLGDPLSVNQRSVMLTEDFYISIYELTDGQNNRMSSRSAGHDSPVSSSYSGWRGTTYFWPKDGSQVAGKLAVYRAATGGLMLDLPTEAQWEIAARAGEENHNLYNGQDPVEVTDATGRRVVPALDDIAWAGWNSTNANGNVTAHPVGLKKPNAWGLYDMLGNMWEMCREYSWTYPTAPSIDPTCASMTVNTSSNYFRRRGGGYSTAAANTTLTSITLVLASWSNEGEGSLDGTGNKSTHGCRAVCPAVAIR